MLRLLFLVVSAASLAGGVGRAGGLYGEPATGAAFEFGAAARTVRVDVASTKTVDVRFPFENASGRPVRIAGANVSCGCVLAGDLPRTVPPGRSDLTLTVDPAQYEPGVPKTVWVDLYTDAATPPPRLTLTVEPFGAAIDPVLLPSPDPLFGSPR